MAISFTIHHKDLKFPPIERLSTVIKRLYERADEKSGGFITISLSLPRRYGTDAQNRTFHALLTEFYISNLHSYVCYEDMRDDFKIRAAGAKEYLYMTIENGRYRQHTCKDIIDIPKNCTWCKIPKSWTEFTKEERNLAINLVITEGLNLGVSSDRWFEIINGMGA